MPDGIIGSGTTFHYWDSSSWATLSDVRSISGPTLSRDTVDDTTYDSPSGYREFISGLRDGGELTLEITFNRDAYDTLKSQYEDDSKQYYEIVLPDDNVTSFEIEGLITSLELNPPLDDIITISVTIKISGQVAIDSGADSSLASGFPN